MRTLCPTSWRVRGHALAGFIDNCTELMDFWDWSLQATSYIENKARLHGVKVVISTFQCPIGNAILNQTDNLS